MAKKPSSSPSAAFGELFATQELRRILTVSQITTQIKRLLEGQLGRVWVTGEVTNFRAQSSGHLYFTLKDATAQLSCVLFRGEAAAQRQHIAEGQKLILGGELTVYEPRGQYQLRVTTVELQGVGALQLAFERLKAKLLAEGLFAQERKRSIPRYPHRIGIATSPTGAAIQDVLHVIARRQPNLEIVLAPCRVQGQGAAEEIAQAVADLNRLHESGTRTLDLILVTRGGGSLEDLWAFNEEVLARALAASALPVVSAVGHEIDVTISDWVADFRAATPTAAAECITEGAYSSRQFVSVAARRVQSLMLRSLEDHQLLLQQLHGRLSRVAPRRWLSDRLQYLDDLRSNLDRSIRTRLSHQREITEHWISRWARLQPSRHLMLCRAELAELKRRLNAGIRLQHQRHQVAWARLKDQLRLLSPTHALSRGYSITLEAQTGRILRNSTEVQPGMQIVTRLQDGELKSRVEQSNPAQ